MNIEFASWTVNLEKGPYARFIQALPAQEKIRLNSFSEADRKKAYAKHIDEAIQARAKVLLAMQKLDPIPYQTSLQAIERHAYFYLVSLSTGADRILLPQNFQEAIAEDEVALSLTMRTEPSLQHIQDAILQSSLLRLEAMKVEVLGVQLKEDRATIQCHHKDWGQTSLVLSLDPHIVDNLQVFSEMGALKEQGIKKIMAAQIQAMNKAFYEKARLDEENKVDEEASLSTGLNKNIKEKLKKASIALFIPDMMKRHSDSALAEVLTQYASTPVSTPESALLQEETFQNMKKRPESKALTLPKKQKAPVQERAPALMQKTQAPPQKNGALSAFKKDMKQQGLSWILGASAGAGTVGSLGLFTTLFS